MVNYAEPVKFQGFDEAEGNQTAVESMMHSISSPRCISHVVSTTYKAYIVQSAESMIAAN